MELPNSLQLHKFLHDSFEYKQILHLFNAFTTIITNTLAYESPIVKSLRPPNLLYQNQFDAGLFCGIVRFSKTRSLSMQAFLQKALPKDSRPRLSK